MPKKQNLTNDGCHKEPFSSCGNVFCARGQKAAFVFLFLLAEETLIDFLNPCQAKIKALLK